jgi:hypothetical protein
MALPATDTFTAADNTQLTTYSANWTLVVGDFDIQLNGLCTDSPSTNAYTAARWDTDLPNADQYTQCTVASTTEGEWHYVGLAIRASSAATTYYGYQGAYGDHILLKMVAASLTQLGAAGSGWRASDVRLLQASGNTITPKLSGSIDYSFGAVTDNSIADGYVGVAGWTYEFGLRNTTRIDNWEGGNLLAAALEQYGYRWRNDDGSETTATWAASQNVNLTSAVGPYRLRVGINGTADNSSYQYQLEWRVSGSGTWRKVV